ncbi:hypothetical protein L917_17281 [Phytophthora nicotianae]|uniref:Uncharacterized protein n=1 Tax=Phytophthora nicotianae TaxID=4792 RepID=W2KDA2_PHYNI|nr:hypothetical protein L917_17281 [Phytophthora nicotianae]
MRRRGASSRHRRYHCRDLGAQVVSNAVFIHFARPRPTPMHLCNQRTTPVYSRAAIVFISTENNPITSTPSRVNSPSHERAPTEVTPSSRNNSSCQAEEIHRSSSKHGVVHSGTSNQHLKRYRMFKLISRRVLLNALIKLFFLSQ